MAIFDYKRIDGEDSEFAAASSPIPLHIWLKRLAPCIAGFCILLVICVAIGIHRAREENARAAKEVAGPSCDGDYHAISALLLKQSVHWIRQACKDDLKRRRCGRACRGALKTYFKQRSCATEDVLDTFEADAEVEAAQQLCGPATSQEHEAGHHVDGKLWRKLVAAVRDECDSDDVGSDVILARDMAACIPETSSLSKCTQLLDRQICKSSLYLHCKRELVKELDSLGCAISCDRPMPTPVPSLPAAQRVFYGMEVVLERWGIDPESEERMFLSACEKPISDDCSDGLAVVARSDKPPVAATKWIFRGGRGPVVLGEPLEVVGIAGGREAFLYLCGRAECKAKQDQSSYHRLGAAIVYHKPSTKTVSWTAESVDDNGQPLFFGVPFTLGSLTEKDFLLSVCSDPPRDLNSVGCGESSSVFGRAFSENINMDASLWVARPAQDTK